MARSRHTRRPRNGPRASVRPFFCGLCNKGFSRRYTVKEPHFLGCVRQKGNPGNLPWDSHPSCWVVRTDGTRGPSGTAPPMGPVEAVEDAKAKESDAALNTPCKGISAKDLSNNVNTTSIEELEDGHDILPRRDLPSSQGFESPSPPYSNKPVQTDPRHQVEFDRSSSPFLPAYPDPETPLAPYRVAPHLSSRLASTPPSQYLSPYPLLSHSTNEVHLAALGQSSSFYNLQTHSNFVRPAQFPSIVRPGLHQQTTPISSLAMNQMASIAIGATREKAGIDDDEAWRMWTLWMDLLPSGVETDIVIPKPGASQKDRQQAVVWLGQDVYSALLTTSEGRSADWLRMAELWQDITRHLNDEDAANKIREILLTQVGGPGARRVYDGFLRRTNFFSILID